jgi:release factor glutamine methyltransferase
MAALGDAVQQTHAALEAAGIPDARLEAELLLTNVLSVPRHRIYAFQEQELTPKETELLASLLERRLTREPLAYILGHKEMYGVDLAIGPGVMVPRPETELLVERCLFLGMVRMEEGDLVIAEPGTGSGGISINLAMHLPVARVYATDLSTEALKIAEINVRMHNVQDRVTLLHGDLLDPVTEPVDLVVANLPYIPSDRIATLQPEVQREPREALDGGPDGLDVIRRLLRQSRDKLKGTGVMVLEIDPEQVQSLTDEALAIFPGATITVEKDLGRLDRMFVLELGGDAP